MPRTVKILMLGLMALFATVFGAGGASGTAGGKFVNDAPSGTAELHPSETTGTEHSLELRSLGNWIECHHTSYDGEIVGEEGTAVTLAPQYTACTLNGGEQKAEFKMNGCHFELTARATEVEAKDSTVHLKCPEGVEAEVLYGSCRNLYGSQTPGGGVLYTTTEVNGKHALTVDFTLTSLHYERVGFCEVFGKTATSDQLLGSITITAVDSVTKAPVNLTVE